MDREQIKKGITEMLRFASNALAGAQELNDKLAELDEADGPEQEG